MAITFDEDNNQVTVELLSQPGKPLTFREPTTRDILLVRSWYANNPDYQTTELMNLKIMQMICIKFGDSRTLLNFDEWLDIVHLDHFVEDMEVLSEAMKYFRLLDRLSKQSDDLDSAE